MFLFLLFFSIAVLSSLVCILDVQFSLTHKLRKNVKGPDAVARCCVPVWEVWRGRTCGKHNQPDDKMSDHPTGFPDLLVWQIEGEEITAWLGTSSFFSPAIAFSSHLVMPILFIKHHVTTKVIPRHFSYGACRDHTLSFTETPHALTSKHLAIAATPIFSEVFFSSFPRCFSSKWLHKQYLLAESCQSCNLIRV